MRLPCVLLSAALLGACTSTTPKADYTVNEGFVANGFPNIPADARAIAERLAACRHLAEEIGGDNLEHDQQVQNTMSRLRCEAIDQEVLAVRRKYAGDKSVEAALSAASDP